MSGCNSGHGLSKASGHIVLLGYNCTAGLAQGCSYRLSIKRFDGRDIEHLGADAFSFKSLGSLKGFPNEVTAGNDAYILSFIEIIDLSDFERLVLRGEVGN